MKMGARFKQYALGGMAALAGVLGGQKDAKAQNLLIFDSGLHAHTNSIGKELVHVQRSEARCVFNGTEPGAHLMFSGAYEYQYLANRFRYTSPNAFSQGVAWYRLWHGVDVGAGVTLQTDPNLPLAASVTPHVNVPLYRFNANGMSAGVDARATYNFKSKLLDEVVENGLLHVGVKGGVTVGGNLDRPQGPIKPITYANAGIFIGLSF